MPPKTIDRNCRTCSKKFRVLISDLGSQYISSNYLEAYQCPKCRVRSNKAITRMFKILTKGARPHEILTIEMQPADLSAILKEAKTCSPVLSVVTPKTEQKSTTAHHVERPTEKA